MGGWKIIDTVGTAWIDLPDTLRADLMTWRWLRGTVERAKLDKKDGKNDAQG